MPAKVMLADEVNNSYVQDVLVSGAAEVVPIYSYKFIASGTASGSVYEGACILHTVSVTNTAAAASFFMLGDTLEASTLSIAGATSAVAIINPVARGSYLYDALIGTGLQYRLSGLDCQGITVTYQVV